MIDAVAMVIGDRVRYKISLDNHVYLGIEANSQTRISDRTYFILVPIPLRGDETMKSAAFFRSLS